MSIDQANVIDRWAIDKVSGALWLFIVDHLPWGEREEGAHLYLLQEKLNTYLAFMESGELLEKVPDAKGRDIVIKLLLKFPPSPMGNSFLELVRDRIEGAGFHLETELFQPE